MSTDLSTATKSWRNQSWTKEKEAKMMELAQSGYYASEISTKMNEFFPDSHYSRNAVIGKMHRMGHAMSDIQDNWTDLEVDTLKTAWATGMPVLGVQAQILHICGTDRTTRAICAKADRLKLTKRMTTKRTIRAGFRPPDLDPLRCPQPFEKRIAPEDYKSNNVPFLELEFYHCREVTGHDGKLAIYCGHKKRDNSSFCAMHHSINYWKVSPNQRKF